EATSEEAGRSGRAVRDRPLRVGDDDLDAAVLLAAGGGGVARDRVFLSVAARADPRARDAALDEGRANGVGGALREAEVELRAADAIGEALDEDVALGVLVEERDEGIDGAAGAGLERRLARIEEHVAEGEHEAAPRELGLELGDLFGELLGTGEGGLGLGAGGLGALALGLGAALRRLGLGGAGLEDDLLTLVAELLDLFPGGVLARGLLRDADALARDIGVVLDEV